MNVIIQDEPLIGICIPVYEKIDLLKRVLESVLKQSYENYIIIITDNSETNLIEEYLGTRNISNLVYFRNEKNLGAAGNTSKAIKAAMDRSVDYIKILYQDDWLTTSDALEKMVKCICMSKASVLFSGNLEVYKECVKKHICRPEEIEEIKRDYSYLFRANKLGAPSNIMFKCVEIYFDASFTWLLDVDFYLRLLPGREMVYIYEPLISIGHDGEQLTDYYMKHPYKMLKETFRQYRKYDWLHTRVNQGYMVKLICYSVKRSVKNLWLAIKEKVKM